MNDLFVPGNRVRLRQDLLILNADLVPTGVTGVVVAASPEEVVVRLDDRRPALDLWDNEVRLHPGDAPGHDLGVLACLLFEPMPTA